MNDWDAATTFYRERVAVDPAFDVIDDMFASRPEWNRIVERPDSWPELVKTVRAVFGISINDAHRRILSHAGFRRLVQKAIDANPDCANYVRNGIRRGTMGNVAALEGDHPVIRLTWRTGLQRL